MDIDLSGHAGIVTGAAGGIGSAIAREMVASGAAVLLVDRSGEVDRTAAEVGAQSCVIDVAFDGAEELILREGADRLGKVDLLVNAAGVQARGPAIELEDEDWERLHAVNFRAVYRLCRAAAKHMIANGTGGSIVNVASSAASVGMPGIVPYGAMKGGVASLTRGLAVELAVQGIRVNALAPGYTRTGMTQELLAHPERLTEVLNRIPMRRIAEPEEIAPAAVFLLSTRASFITGETFHVDGGQVAQ